MDTNATLLAVQRLDQEAAALRERRATLPELAERKACGTALEALARERAGADDRRVPLEREERRLEGEVADVAEKARGVEEKLYSGKVTAPRELEDLQSEMQAFQRRQGELEEEELAVMEQVEALDGEVRALETRREELDARTQELTRAIEAARAEIDAELERVAGERAGLAPELPEALLAVYDRVRQQDRLKGQAAAAFEEGRCGGCRVALPVMDVSRIRREPPEVVIQCPRCSRILLR